ncbi:DUF4878 domain-containing protein [Clostridium sp. MB40-C1]|uniref:DUF4878 domain-containing protein n=1 Tax=Clostridium sp. MB40-C1 TaxID=3070996 RepID=UPI0027E08F7A|nr:DUF4878 domain-containing protein [Clostridium sp. MB40-C1]WMJ80952.1 DUF4878 domain-containing protein [Clostridium sp. MB40-C1]
MKNSNKVLAIFFVLLFIVFFMLGTGLGFYCVKFETTPKSIATNALSFFSKSSKPQESVKAYFDCLKKQDTKKAATYIRESSDEAKSTNEDNKPKFENKYEEKILQEFTSKLKYEILSTKINGNNAKVKVKITAPNLTKITANIITELLPTIFSQAISGKQDNKKVENMTMERLLNSLKDSEVSMSTSEIDIELLKDKEKKMWLIVGNDELFNALTGDLGKVFGDLEKSMKK